MLGKRSAVMASAAMALVLTATSQAKAEAVDRRVLPIPAPEPAKLGSTAAESIPAPWGPVRAPVGAPNILLIMTDDVGFGATSVFGGPVATPNLQRLASRGLRYNNFHTTGICSPSRAALLTGRNQHAVGAGHLADVSAGYPGYDGRIPASTATVARILRENGYSTAFFGKHHNVPVFEASSAGPFTNWPTNLGFDYFYGFVGGDVDQWRPRLFRGTTQVDDALETSGDVLDKRLTDDALRWLHNQDAAAPDKPFFIYFAPGSTHAPHQAPAEWIERFRGKFDAGWDEIREEILNRQKALGVAPRDARLTPRPTEIPAWSSLTPQMKRVHARAMEVYAAQLAYQDAQLGRMLDELDRMGELDRTLVVFIAGDNGGSAEAGPRPTTNEIGAMANGVRETDAQFVAFLTELGGPRSYGNYSAGWAHAMNTPFPWFKQIPALGGTRNGMILSWPERAPADGRVRTGFAHVNDVAPTLLEAAGTPAPQVVDGAAQRPMDGVSLVPTWVDPRADNHPTQYFELAGVRAIYHRGWMATTTPQRMPWDERPQPPQNPVWELYDLRADFSQSRNLAKAEPQRLQEMVALWEAEARRNNVYPIDDRPNTLRSASSQAARPAAGRTRFTYWGADVSVSQAAAPNFAGRSFTLEATIDGSDAPHGVLLATGSWFGGWSFHFDHGRPVAVQAVSQLPGEAYSVAASDPVAPGPAKVRFEFVSDGGVYAGGAMTISVNGQRVAQGRIPRTIGIVAGLGETLDIGRDTGVPVSAAHGRGAFNGLIRRVDVELLDARR